MSTIVLIVLALVAIGAIVGLIVVGMRNSRADYDPLAERLSEYGGAAEIEANLEEVEMSLPFTERVLIPLAQKFAQFTMQFTPAETLEKTQKKLDLAGNPPGWTPAVFWAARFGAMVGMGALLFLVFAVTKQKTSFIILGGLGGAALGFVLPQMVLEQDPAPPAGGHQVSAGCARPDVDLRECRSGL